MCVFRRLFIFSIFGLSTISFTSAAETVELKPNDAVYVKMGKKVTWNSALVVMVSILKAKMAGVTRKLMVCG